VVAAIVFLAAGPIGDLLNVPSASVQAAAFGLIFVAVAVARLIYDPNPIFIKPPQFLQGQTVIGTRSFPTYRLAIIVASGVLIAALWIGLERTRWGAMVRAAVDNRAMAQSVGINTRLLFMLTFALGSGLAGLGGALGADILPVQWAYPFEHLVYFLIVVAVGGLGTLRGPFIAALLIGVADTACKYWVPEFGAFLVYTGVMLLVKDEAPPDPERNPAVRIARRLFPVTPEGAGKSFFVRRGGKIHATPLLIVLLVVETTDLVFALDSIPAVFGVTRDLFVVFTSNAFAVLGLRALYFLLAGSADRFVYLKPGIALLLVFIGVKMLLYDVVHMPVWVSLVVIAVVAGGAIGASLWRDRRLSRLREVPRPAAEPRPAGDSRPVAESRGPVRT